MGENTERSRLPSRSLTRALEPGSAPSYVTTLRLTKVGESCVARHTARLGGVEQRARLGVRTLEAREELPPQRRLVGRLHTRRARQGRRRTALAAAAAPAPAAAATAAAGAAIVACHLQWRRGVRPYTSSTRHAVRDARRNSW